MEDRKACSDHLLEGREEKSLKGKSGRMVKGLSHHDSVLQILEISEIFIIINLFIYWPLCMPCGILDLRQEIKLMLTALEA